MKQYLFKPLAFSACLAVFSLPSYAANLHIKAGSTYLVKANQAKLSLDKLTIDDKAQIQLADDVDVWRVDAKEASIGYGVVITGRGESGRDGANGVSHREADECQTGKAGGDGLMGVSGEAGSSIHWALGVVSFGSVSIDLSGGNGGAGGNGGDGQNIPDFPQCTASGGDAGSGGAGGNGGKGGSFRFHYTLAEGVQDLTNSVEVKISGGLRGKGGQPGIAGIGTSGRYVNKKSLSGSRSWVAGGGDGTSGTAGVAGVSGANGSLDIRLTNKVKAPDEQPSPQNEAQTPDLLQRVKSLEILTQKLEARIRLLELENE